MKQAEYNCYSIVIYSVQCLTTWTSSDYHCSLFFKHECFSHNWTVWQYPLGYLQFSQQFDPIQTEHRISFHSIFTKKYLTISVYSDWNLEYLRTMYFVRKFGIFSTENILTNACNNRLRKFLTTVSWKVLLISLVNFVSAVFTNEKFQSVC